MEHVACNLCQGDDAVLLFSAVDLNHQCPGCFQIVKCRNCGLVYLNPRPGKEKLPQYYPDNYYLPPPPERAPDGQTPEKTGILEKRILQYKRPGTILDIGCKCGAFLAGLKTPGWQAYGVEISPLAAQAARARHGLKVTTADFAETHFQNGQFEVVTLWQTLEHLRDPLATLREINRIIKPDGLLVISVPNIDSFQARIFKARWFHLDAPRHLFHFSPRTIRILLAKAGFDLQAVNHCGGRHNYVGLRMSLRYVLQRPGPRPAIAQNVPARQQFSLLKSCFNRCCNFVAALENLSGHGGTIEVYAKKRKQASA